jgi:hypothetical protein
MRVTIATLACLAASTAFAQASPRVTNRLSSVEEHFLEDATRASLAQVELGQLAVQNRS